MTNNWMARIDERSASALACGALQPVIVEQTELTQAGMRFLARWVSSLAVKDATAQVAVPGGPRDPDFNPFLNPEVPLTVGPLGDAHVAILNKFPLCTRHLVLARRVFEEQLLPLAHNDFAALAIIMHEAGGIGLYNGGTVAGASQRHKHVQWVPEATDGASLGIYRDGLPADLPEQGVATHAALAARHCFVRVRCGAGVPVPEAADSLHAGFVRACETLGLVPDGDGRLPPYNLLASAGWLLVLPRRVEHFEGISLSAVCFAGTLYTRTPEQIEALRRVGPLQALAAVGYPVGG